MKHVLEGQHREIIRCAADIRFSIQNNKLDDVRKYCTEMQTRTGQIMAMLDDEHAGQYILNLEEKCTNTG